MRQRTAAAVVDALVIFRWQFHRGHEELIDGCYSSSRGLRNVRSSMQPWRCPADGSARVRLQLGRSIGRRSWLEELTNPPRMFLSWSFGQLQKARKRVPQLQSRPVCSVPSLLERLTQVDAYVGRSKPFVGHALTLTQIKKCYIGDFERQSAARSILDIATMNAS